MRSFPFKGFRGSRDFYNLGYRKCFSCTRRGYQTHGRISEHSNKRFENKRNLPRVYQQVCLQKTLEAVLLSKTAGVTGAGTAWIADRAPQAASWVKKQIHFGHG
eukprot:156992-Amphidinium_carterae.1